MSSLTARVPASAESTSRDSDHTTDRPELDPTRLSRTDHRAGETPEEGVPPGFARA